MKSEEIYSLEKSNSDRINLVKAGKFWQAWEHSAFYFSTYLRPFKISYKLVQKISTGFVYLGFPDTILAEILESATNAGYHVNRLNELHIIISGLKPPTGFDEWKESHIKNISAVKHDPTKLVTDKMGNILLANRTAFDLAVYLLQTSQNFERSYRFDLGGFIRTDAINLSKTLHLAANCKKPLLTDQLQELLAQLRIEIRLAHEVKQIRDRQWFYICSQIERILTLLALESCDSETTGESGLESSNPLDPAIVGTSEQAPAVFSGTEKTATDLTPGHKRDC